MCVCGGGGVLQMVREYEQPLHPPRPSLLHGSCTAPPSHSRPRSPTPRSPCDNPSTGPNTHYPPPPPSIISDTLLCAEAAAPDQLSPSYGRSQHTTRTAPRESPVAGEAGGRRGTWTGVFGSFSCASRSSPTRGAKAGGSTGCRIDQPHTHTRTHTTQRTTAVRVRRRGASARASQTRCFSKW